MLMIFPAGALAASPPTITSSFYPSAVGVGDTSTISYAITDPTGNTTLTNVGFTDTLPAGLTVDTPNGSNVGKSCNPASPAPAATLTANSGSSTITLSGASVKAGRDDAATVTSGSATVTDASIASTDAGKLVTGTGIPPFTYVGTVTPGVSFLLSSTPSPQVDVPATADGTTVTVTPACIVSVNVTSNTAGIYQNSTGNVTSDQGTGNSDTETLTVLNPPTVTITTPARNATYAYGQSVIASYSCQDDPNGPGIQQDGCQGNVPNGSPINTTHPGKRSFTVTAISQDGQVTFKTVQYTVLAGNHFTVKNVYGAPNGRVGFDIDPQNRGKFSVVEHAVIKGQSGQKPTLFGQMRGTVGGPAGFVVHPSSSGQAMVKEVRSADKNGQYGQILVTMAVTFTPAEGGAGRTQTYHVTISP